MGTSVYCLKKVRLGKKQAVRQSDKSQQFSHITYATLYGDQTESQHN